MHRSMIIAIGAIGLFIVLSIGLAACFVLAGRTGNSGSPAPPSNDPQASAESQEPAPPAINNDDFKIIQDHVSRKIGSKCVVLSTKQRIYQDSDTIPTRSYDVEVSIPAGDRGEIVRSYMMRVDPKEGKVTWMTDSWRVP